MLWITYYFNFNINLAIMFRINTVYESNKNCISIILIQLKCMILRFNLNSMIHLSIIIINSDVFLVLKVIAAVMEKQQQQQQQNTNAGSTNSANGGSSGSGGPSDEFHSEFYNTGRIGRRNAMSDILGNDATTTTAGLDEKLSALTTNGLDKKNNQ